MITNLMMDSIVDWDNISIDEASNVEKLVILEFDKLINYFSQIDKTLILVTNEVGLGIVPMYPSARLFRDMAGRVNQKLAAIADEVYMCVSGIPIKIK
jgi:adenosylcobinamide kinase/adenosylcobinamide-phosphate guanylyltransferase